MPTLSFHSVFPDGGTQTTTRQVEDWDYTVILVEAVIQAAIKQDMRDYLYTGTPSNFTAEYLNAVYLWLESDGSQPFVGKRVSGRVDTYTFTA
jgi:hypothetical protein